MKKKTDTVPFEGKEHNVYTITFDDGKSYRVILVPKRYEANDRLAIEAMTVRRSGEIEPWAVVTVNFPDEPVGKDGAFANTTNFPWLFRLAADEGLASYVGKLHPSGYNTYPLFKWKTERFTA